MNDKCIHCGDARDSSPHGMRYNLGLSDEGIIGGQGMCGDAHEWTEEFVEPYACPYCGFDGPWSYSSNDGSCPACGSV
jgi:rubrerythrin